jgi:hypothetical protein
VGDLDQVTESVTQYALPRDLRLLSARSEARKQITLSVGHCRRVFERESLLPSDTERAANSFRKRLVWTAKKIVFGLGLLAIIVFIASFARNGMTGVHYAFERWAKLVT